MLWSVGIDLWKEQKQQLRQFNLANRVMRKFRRKCDILSQELEHSIRVSSVYRISSAGEICHFPYWQQRWSMIFFPKNWSIQSGWGLCLWYLKCWRNIIFPAKNKDATWYSFPRTGAFKSGWVVCLWYLKCWRNLSFPYWQQTWYSFPRTEAFCQGEFCVYGTSSAGEIYHFPLLTTKIIHDILSQELEHSIRVSCMFMVPQVLEKSIIFPH